MDMVAGFELSSTLSKKIWENSYCRSILYALSRFNVVFFQVDDSPQQQEVVELLKRDTSYWKVFTHTEGHSYYIVSLDAVEVKSNGTII